MRKKEGIGAFETSMFKTLHQGTERVSVGAQETTNQERAGAFLLQAHCEQKSSTSWLKMWSSSKWRGTLDFLGSSHTE